MNISKLTDQLQLPLLLFKSVIVNIAYLISLESFWNADSNNTKFVKFGQILTNIQLKMCFGQFQKKKKNPVAIS
jgi:hypothetical protein